MYNVTAKPNTKIIRILSEYRKSSITPPRGLLVSSPFKDGLNRDRGRGGLI